MANTDSHSISAKSVLSSEFCTRLREDCAPTIERVTVPLYGIQEKKIKHDRTGVLYRVADHFFILTASHDLREIIENQIPLYVGLGDCEELPYPIVVDCVFHTTEVDQGRDVAAIRLGQGSIAMLQSAKQFLAHNQVDHHDDGCGIYIVFGFPMAWRGVVKTGQVCARPLVYLCARHEGETCKEEFYDPSVHVLLGFDRVAVDVLGGNEVDLPEIKGISGCGIWRVADLDIRMKGQLSVHKPRLVALQHHWSQEKRYVKGTWIKYATSRILDDYPELLRPMSLIYPR